jgi:hypothetical protein
MLSPDKGRRIGIFASLGQRAVITVLLWIENVLSAL